MSALAPLIGYECVHDTLAKAGWSSCASKGDVEEWTKTGLSIMKGWEETFRRVEKESERMGWHKVRWGAHEHGD